MIKPQFICQAHEEPLNLICMEEACQKIGLICVQCQYQYHKHQIQSVGIMMEQMMKDLHAYENNLFVLCQIDELYQQALNHSEKIKSQPQKKLLRETIDRYYYHLSNQIHQRIQKIKEFFNNQHHTQSSFQRQLLSYQHQPKQPQQKHLSYLEIKLNQQRSEFVQSVKELEEFIKSNEQIDKMLMLFMIQDGKRTNYQFSQEKKHKDINVEKNIAKMKDGYSYRIALLDPPIRKQNGKTFKKSLNFKILKLSAMIGVGVSYTQKISSANYSFGAYSQHGCYLISNNGYTYNQSNSQFNSQMKNWTFAIDDIINVTIDPKDKTIRFKKNEDSTFEFSYVEKPQCQLCFAVLLCCAEESIEIVNG